MGRYHHDFEPGGSGREKPLPAHKRTAIAYFVLAAVALAVGVALPFLASVI